MNSLPTRFRKIGIPLVTAIASTSILINAAIPAGAQSTPAGDAENVINAIEVGRDGKPGTLSSQRCTTTSTCT
jgi:hypothetical protein